MSKENNPFHYGKMITDPAQFFGRRNELATIIDRLNSSQVQGSAICGPRRIGKSSLLHYLYQPRSDELLRANSNQLVIYLDAQANECSTPTAFHTTLIRTILDDPCLKIDGRTTEGKKVNEIRQRLDSQETCNGSQAKLVLENLPCHPVICLDEFEALLTDEFNTAFFNNLRSWNNSGLLTWITASAEELSELGIERHPTSPFFNQLASVPLADFTADEVDPLLNRANGTCYPLTDRERRIIKHVAQCNPYHLQIVAAGVWLRKKQGHRVSKRWAKAALKQQLDKPTLSTDEQPKSPLTWHLIYIGIILLLLCGIVYDPLAMQGILHSCLDMLLIFWTKLCEIWDPVAAFIQNLEAWIKLVIIIVITLTGIRQRKSLLELGRQVWKKFNS